MTGRRAFALLLGCLLLIPGAAAQAQSLGGLRGRVTDADFQAPVAGVTVKVAENDRTATTDGEGQYVLQEMTPGTYTLVFARDGYTRRVVPDVVVEPGRMRDLDVRMTGDFAQMSEFIVQDLKLEAGSEAALLDLRLQSPALMDSISAEFMSAAGAGDAADALKLVAGASVQDDKAVIRGLPPRFVSSQLNGVRLPSADTQTRSVELDQFPASVIESIQVSKTFTPDQQGDASGGAVNIVTQSIPETFIFEIGAGTSFNSQAKGRNDFLSSRGGGIGFFEFDPGRGEGDPADLGGIGLGVAGANPAFGSSFDLTLGGRHALTDQVTVGGITSLFYSRDFDFFDDGEDNTLVGTAPPGGGNKLVVLPNGDAVGTETTALFDVTEGTETVQWGQFASAGIEIEDHALGVTFLRTRTLSDTAKNAEDTRGRAFADQIDIGEKFTRSESLRFTDRTSESLQFHGAHTLPFPEKLELGPAFALLAPELEWRFSENRAEEDEPDRRQFGEQLDLSDNFPGADGIQRPLKPSTSGANLGNIQRIFERVEEEGAQWALDFKLPFEQWSGDQGFLKFGYFRDEVDRTFEQSTFTNNAQGGFMIGSFDEPLSDAFEDGSFEAFSDFGANNRINPIRASEIDVPYTGTFDIDAWYAMADLPLNDWVKLIGGARFESTDIRIVADPEAESVIVPNPAVTQAVDAIGSDGSRVTDPVSGLPLGDAAFEDDDVLPSISAVFEPHETLTLRLAYTETIARQTFRELSPSAQQEFLGGDIFVGNPNLEAASVQNYDVRLDYRPFKGGLFSVSGFHKDVENPIEVVQGFANNLGTFSTPVNFPEGQLSGVELEARQQLGELFEPLEGLDLGVNFTYIDSEVTLSDAEVGRLGNSSLASIGGRITEREMTNAPEFLLNANLGYEIEPTGTRFALTYSLVGDTLTAGPGNSGGDFIPAVFRESHETLTFTLRQKLGEHFTLSFKAKNLTNPEIRDVFRSDFTSEAVKESHRAGVDFSLSLTAKFTF